MPEINPPETIQDLPLVVVKNMIALCTSGFGVVVALAWNEFIKKFVETYIDRYFGKDGGLISQFIYAIIITLLAILFTMQLASLQRKMETIQKLLLKKNQKIEDKED